METSKNGIMVDVSTTGNEDSGESVVPSVAKELNHDPGNHGNTAPIATNPHPQAPVPSFPTSEFTATMLAEFQTLGNHVSIWGNHLNGQIEFEGKLSADRFNKLEAEVADMRAEQKCLSSTVQGIMNKLSDHLLSIPDGNRNLSAAGAAVASALEGNRAFTTVVVPGKEEPDTWMLSPSEFTRVITSKSKQEFCRLVLLIRHANDPQLLTYTPSGTKVTGRRKGKHADLPAKKLPLETFYHAVEGMKKLFPPPVILSMKDLTEEQRLEVMKHHEEEYKNEATYFLGRVLGTLRREGKIAPPLDSSTTPVSGGQKSGSSARRNLNKDLNDTLYFDQDSDVSMLENSD